ncbi:RbsD / FucU transport protein family protein [Spirosomataceae bacterium TFI 002]|nr:RbsD / FucU transport protein family protein [Spirosomataceae bacterium TFI 002]
MIRKIVPVFLIMIGLLSCSKPVENKNNIETMSEVSDWKLEVEKTLKLYGHRNWIVIADGAYPQQSNPAIKTITIDADQLEAVEYVNQLIEKAKHVEANILIDKEMEFVPEKAAKGIESYRAKLEKILEGKPVKTMLHEDIIRELDASAKLFNVLVIKTDLAIPYTSVFFQLECGYWNSEAEENLRKELTRN